MKTLSLLALAHVFLFLSAAGNASETFVCKDERGMKITIAAEFTSPQSISEIHSDKTVMKLINSGEACGTKLNFTSDCQTNLVKSTEANEFSFRCDNVFGDFYFADKPGSEFEFRCFGEGVSEVYAHRLYKECEKSKN